MDKVISIMQPNYLPWLGYFEIIDRSEIFVFFDDVQFIKKDWDHRNRIKTNESAFWLTVPVLSKGKRFQKINEVKINNQINWKHKHLKNIESFYSKSKYYQQYISFFRKIYEKNWSALNYLNIETTIDIMKILNIESNCYLSSEMELISTENNDRIIEICKKLNCTELYNSQGAKKIINSEKINNAGINIIFQDYKHPLYNQLHGTFTSHLSIVDLLFNEGPKSLDIIRSGTNF